MEEISYYILKKLCSISTSEMNYSFNLIFKKYSKLVYYVAFDILKDDDETKDIVNETFMKMYENRRKFMSESSLKYFLLVSAKNLAINRYNKLKNHLPYDDDISSSKEDIESNSNISIYLEKFKEILDEKEYRYLVLHLLYEFSFKEIAKTYDLTTSQVSSKYRRALEKLKSFYKGAK